MRITVFNDTHKDWRLHVGSLRGVNGENRIPAQQSVDFDLPDGCDAFVKLWETGVVLVRPFQVAPPQTELPFGN